MSLLIKGVTKFIKLTDVPSSYAGAGKKGVRVKATVDGLEFGTPANVFTKSFDGSIDVPTSCPWAYEAPASWSVVTRLCFSPVIQNAIGQKEVYVMDLGKNFYRYNFTTKQYTKLPDAAYNGHTDSRRRLAISPDGTKIATVSDPGAEGALRIEIFNISTQTWSASPQVTGTYNSTLRALVWQDNDIIWVWARAVGQNRGKCLKYVSSTSTWTAFASDTGAVTYWTCENAAMKADNSVVIAGYVGNGASVYAIYTVGTDTYTFSGAGDRQFQTSADKERLWFCYSGNNYGYTRVSDYVDVQGVLPPNNIYIGYGHGFWPTSGAICAYATANSIPTSYFGTGSWKLKQLVLTQWTLVIIDKPSDSFGVLVNEPTLMRQSIHYGLSLVNLPAGTWDFYYPKDGDYTKIKIYTCPLEGP